MSAEQFCELCNAGVTAVFDPASGSRAVEVLAGDRFVEDQCFVADEIRFLNGGRLIFVPAQRREGRYFDEYFVVCRKLVIIGGKPPGSFNPCGPEDPGSLYQGNNVITWSDRLTTAAAGPPPAPLAAAGGQSFDRHNWSDQGQGNNGRNGGRGADGGDGSRGGDGKPAPSFNLIVLEIETQLLSHLTIDFDGQVGGQGGRGQNGGNGGDGMGGRIGESDTSWPGTGCDRQPGAGGNGGDGGNGGRGGRGGPGGAAGRITVLSTLANITTGPLVSGSVSYVNDGGQGGIGGRGGVGGRGGRGGTPGFKTSECDPATAGLDGVDGSPPGFPTGPGSLDNAGPAGTPGAAGILSLSKLAEERCALLLPKPVALDGLGLQPKHHCRGFSTPNTSEGKLTGSNLAQVKGAVVGLAGVSASVKPASTDTELILKFDIAGTSALGPGNLTLERAFGPPVALPGAIEIRRFEVTGVAPNSGARGTSVAVTISGHCFDGGAAIQQVNISGVGVSALNVLVLDEQTIQCVFETSNLAALGARNVTVKTGSLQHTLLNAFNVTA